MIREKNTQEVRSLRVSARMQRLIDELMQAEKEKKTSTLQARIAREALSRTAGRPAMARRAEVVADLLKRMPVYIREGELLVGNRSEALGVQPVALEEKIDIRGDIMLHETRGMYAFFWEQLGEAHRVADEEYMAGYPAGRSSGFGHILADYELVAREGAERIAQRAQEAAERFAAEGKEKEAVFCRASATAWRAFAGWGERYAEVAEQQARTCGDAQRAVELRRIAANCRRVPRYGARDFYEALQAVWFTHQAMLLEQYNGSISFGNFDQYMQRYYEDDLAAGRITRAFAELLLENFAVKNMENAIWPREVVTFTNLAVGGQDANGNDMTNDMSWMMLDMLIKTRSPHPMLSVRYHERIDRDFWHRTVECVGLGCGLPALFHDKYMIECLVRGGIPREKAVHYGVIGCVEPGIRAQMHDHTLGGHINLLKCLEVACNDGRSVLTGRRMGVSTGFLKDFTSFDDVWEAYRAQVDEACRLNRDAVFAVARAHRAYYGYPLMSALMEGIEFGRDLSEAVRYEVPSVCITGSTNVVDALLAIKELAFVRQTHTPAQLFAAMAANFEGCEDVRRAIETCPHYGNGGAEAVALYNDVCQMYTDMLFQMEGPRGGVFCGGLWTTTWHVIQGKWTAASLDGRRAGEPLCDSVGPLSGHATEGPTAVIRDVASLKAAEHWRGGITFNLRLAPSLFDTAESVEKVAQFIETYFALGGMQIQINTIGVETLRAAQRTPESYADLVVRVAGFSAYFTALAPEVQEEIIARTEFSVA